MHFRNKYLRAIKERLLGTIVRVNTDKQLIALTFDDGPDPETTPKLLTVLKKYQAKATFFMLGEAAERSPLLVERVHDEGHAIGNHSWNHPSFPLIHGYQRRKQIRDCEATLNHHGVKIFRPPFGHFDLATRLDAIQLGYKIVMFDVVAEDWRDHDAQWMVDKLIRETKAGSIVLFHDALYYVFDDDYASRNAMLMAVDMLLDKLSNQYQFVTIPQLLKCGKPVRKVIFKKENVQWLSGLKKTKTIPQANNT